MTKKKTESVDDVSQVPHYKFRNEFYKVGEKPNGLKCRSTRKMYRLNKATNILEAYDETNIQDFVNSYRDTALSSVLEKYLPVPDASDDVVGEYMSNLDDLDYLTEAQATAENLRSKYNLDENLDWKQIFGEVSKRNETLKQRIDIDMRNRNFMQSNKNLKEDSKNEKKEDIEKNQQPQL